MNFRDAAGLDRFAATNPISGPQAASLETYDRLQNAPCGPASELAAARRPLLMHQTKEFIHG
jgi:hypothetical protein